MEVIIEILCEVVLDGIVEVITNKKINKWIRYPLTAVFLSFYLCVIVLVGVLSIKLWHESILASIILIAINLLLIIGLVLIIKKVISKQK